MEYKENKRETGTRKEELAADFLTRRGVKILISDLKIEPFSKKKKFKS